MYQATTSSKLLKEQYGFALIIFTQLLLGEDPNGKLQCTKQQLGAEYCSENPQMSGTATCLLVYAQMMVKK